MTVRCTKTKEVCEKERTCIQYSANALHYCTQYGNVNKCHNESYDTTCSSTSTCTRPATCYKSATCYRTATCDSHDAPCTSKRNKSCTLTHDKMCNGYYDVIEWQDWSNYQSDSINEVKSNQTCENIKRVQTRDGYVYNDNIVVE